MAKENRPILPFYANDFLGSTAAMEPAEVGMYIRLLSYQWINGPFPSSFKSVCRLAGIESSDVDASAMLRALLEHKFSIDLAGNYSNKRLEVERAGSFEKDAERKAKAKRAADIRWENERLRKAEAEFEKNNSDNSNFEDATSNALSNANAYAKDHAKSMLTEYEYESSIGSIGSIEETSINHHRGVQGGNGKSREPFANHIENFISAYGGIKGGNRRAIEVAYIESVNTLNTEGKSDLAAHELLAIQAARDREYCKQASQTRHNTENWLKKRLWEKDYDQELKMWQETQENKKIGGNGHGKPESVTSKIIKFNRHTGI